MAMPMRLTKNMAEAFNSIALSIDGMNFLISFRDFIDRIPYLHEKSCKFLNYQAIN
jgi:hypothetical protein